MQGKLWAILALSLLGGGLAGTAVLNSLSVRPQDPAPSRQTTGSKENRYRSGSLALVMGDFPAAQRQFEGLARLYPALAERIDLKLALSRNQSRNWIAANPKSMLVPEALAFAALHQDRLSLEQLLSRYPDHPATRKALESLVEEKTVRRSWLVHLVERFPRSRGATVAANRLESLGKLSPREWQALATVLGRSAPQRAVVAYSHAPTTAANLFDRAALLKNLGRKVEARALLEQLVVRFPGEALAFDAQLAIADLLPPSMAVERVEQAGRAYPAQADEALWAASQIWVKRLAAPERAADDYLVLVQRYPSSTRSANAAWELASLSANRSDLSTARRYADFILSRHPTDPFAAKAAFWSGKWAEQSGDPAGARKRYRLVYERYPNSYYAWRSAARLGLADGSYDLGFKAVSVRWSASNPPVPAASLAVRTLLALDEVRDAEAQWQAETAGRSLAPAEKLTEAFFAARQGNHLRAINTASEVLGSSAPQDPASRTQAYPLFYGPQLQHWSSERGLNPLLVAALIRQESRFEPAIRSRSNAVGLMQLLPSTAEWMAHRDPLPATPSTSQTATSFDLVNPDDNIRLGTLYLRYTHQKWDGNTLLAIASYNAGPGNVARWLRQISMDDPETFIERIPFRETRFYIVNIYENYWNYLRLYGGGPG